MRVVERRSNTGQADPKIRKMHGILNASAEHKGGVSEVLDPKELFAGLWRRKKVILLTVLLCLALMLLALSQIKPVYRADLSLLIQGKQSSLIEFSSDKPDYALNLEFVESEVEVIRSRRLAEKVIEKLQLHSVLEFNPDADSGRAFPGFWDWLKGRLGLGDLNLHGTSVPVDTKVQAGEVLAAFSDRLKVRIKGQSRVLAVTFDSVDSDLSANVVNALADFYVEEQVELKTTTSDKTLVELLARIKPLQEQVEQSESALVLLRRDAGLLGETEHTLDSQQLVGLNQELSRAQNRFLEARARLRQAKRVLKSSNGESIPAVLKSSTINRLQEDKAELQRQIDELSVEYGRAHPSVVQLQSKIEGLQGNIRVDVARVVSALSNEVSIARRNLSALQARMEEVKGQSVEKSSVAVRYRALEREAEADRVLLEALLARLREAETQSNVSVQQADARIISYATVPLAASFPRKGPMLVLSVFIALLLGIVYVLITEAMDNGFRDIALVEKQTGLPMIGFVPDVAKNDQDSDVPLDVLLTQKYAQFCDVVREFVAELKSQDSDGKAKSPSNAAVAKSDDESLVDIILSDQRSAFSDSIHAIHSGLRLQNGGKQPKSILISSTQTSEGKSTLVSCIAAARVRNGDKVVVVDTDLRKASLNQILRIPQHAGVAEYFAGTSVLDDIIQHDPKSGVDVVAAGHSSDSFVDILFSDQFDTMLTALADRYDLIILDSPPVLEAQDAKILATKADQTVFVAKWGETKRKHVCQAIEQLQASGSNVAGLLINCVDVSELATYGYGGTGYGYGLNKTNVS